MLIWQRTRNGIKDRRYSYKFEWRTKQILRQTKFTDEGAARRRANEHLIALEEGVTTAAFRARQPKTHALIKALVTAYIEAAGDRPSTRQNITALMRLLQLLYPAKGDVLDHPVTVLGSDAVYRYCESVRAAARAEGADRAREAQLFRSANSELAKVRSIFAPDKIAYYTRTAKLALGDAWRGFREEPAFRGVRKKEYSAPDDALLAKTFGDLERLAGEDRNLYLAVWLACGFGLRASEIAKARVGFFVERNGGVWLRSNALAKNGSYPDVPAQNGAWERLRPFLMGRGEEEFVLSGTASEITFDVFRRCSIWMQNLGWQTQKKIHEFRAWAICQVGIKTGCIITMSSWARHSSIVVTQQFYGRYLTLDKASRLTS